MRVRCAYFPVLPPFSPLATPSTGWPHCLPVLRCTAGSNQSAQQQFASADANADGVVDEAEFAAFLEAQLAQQQADCNRPLTQHQLLMIATRAAIGEMG